jgi:DNA-binding GntR family transcriptional regulator
MREEGRFFVDMSLPLRCNLADIDTSEQALMLQQPKEPRHEGANSAPSPGRRLLKDRAYEMMRVLLVERAEPHQVFSERQLASHFGIGLAAVRSAVERLRVEGFISAAPNAGIRLPELTAQSIIDFYEMRMIVESHVVSSLAGRLTPSQIAKIEEILRQQDECLEQGYSEKYHNLDSAFHIGLAEFHGNNEMVRVLQHWRDKTHYISKSVLQRYPERRRINVAQHRAIAVAVFDGDGVKAQNLVGDHLRWGSSYVLDPGMRNLRWGNSRLS